MSDQSSEREPPSERSAWSRPSVLLSAAFLLALVLLGILVAAAGGGSHTSAVRTSPRTGEPAAGTATVNSRAGGCALRAPDQSVPATSPPPVQWQPVGSMEAPQARSSLGPGRIGGVWNTCFAHSPDGALLAAFNLWAESTAAPSGQVYRHLAVDVPPPAYETATHLDDDGPVQFAGYRYQSYTPSTAQLLVVVRGPQGMLGAFATTMRWIGSDWRYAFPPGGQLSFQVIPDLTGYVRWSAF